MTYESIEPTVDSGMPIILLEFSQGDETYRFTSYDKNYTYSGYIYQPTYFSFDRLRQTADPFKNDLNISFNQSNTFAFQQAVYRNSEPTTVIVRRGHVDDGDFFIQWKGRVIGREINNSEINLVCESVFTKLKAIGLRAKYEHYCRHTLYSAQCAANKPSKTVVGTVDSVSGNVISISEVDALADGYFDLGVVDIGGVKRAVLSHIGANLSLLSPFDTNILGLSASVSAGCNKTLAICDSKFSNTINFGGFPYIPVRNPFEGTPF